MKAPKPTKMYNLVYYIGKIKQETVMVNQPIALCTWKKNQIKNSSHRLGRLEIEPLETISKKSNKIENKPKTSVKKGPQQPDPYTESLNELKMHSDARRSNRTFQKIRYGK